MDLGHADQRLPRRGVPVRAAGMTGRSNGFNRPPLLPPALGWSHIKGVGGTQATEIEVLQERNGSGKITLLSSMSKEIVT